MGIGSKETAVKVTKLSTAGICYDLDETWS